MPEMGDKVREKLAKLVGLLGSDNAGERENARCKIDETLRRHRKTWNDLIELLRAGSSSLPRDIAEDDEGANEASNGANVSALDLVYYMLEEHVALESQEYLAVALWVLHAHVYNRFMVTPRLALTSPVRGCGKTTLLSVIERLVRLARKTDGITPAATYRLIDREHCTLLVDEADNLGLSVNGALRAVLNSGHRKGGTVTKFIGDYPRPFSTFAPMAIAAIGALPLPLMHRSLVIRMKRHDGSRKLKRFDENDTAATTDFDTVYQQICAWVRNVNLDADPEMPPQLRNRQADNWRPLIAIADSFGPGWGAAARDAAVTFQEEYSDEDAGVMLLTDIRDLFNTRRVDRLASATIVAALNDLEDGPWCEWRGVRDDQTPRRFSQGELARLLAPFGIRSRSIWPPRRDAGSKSAKGYHRWQFENAWRSYCDGDGTAAQRKNIRHLWSV